VIIASVLTGWGSTAGSALEKAIGASDAAVAVAWYGKVAADKKAPDSLRAIAWTALGEYQLAAGTCDSARSCFSYANALVPDDRLVEQKARSALCAGDTAEAVLLWESITTRSSAARYALSRIAFLRADYTGALKLLEESIAGRDSALIVPSLVLAIRASELSGRDEIAASYRTRLAAFGEDIPEHALALSAGVSGWEKKNPWVLQVGAFSQLENAERLRERMKARFTTVDVVAQARGSSTLHRVWVGRFPTEKKARAFGEKHLRPDDTSFRVVRDK
jgi:hypothetical protein